MVEQISLTGSQLGFVLLYFIYGLAFFTMGIALALESRRSPALAERRALVPLAVFGLLHGLHEWMEIVLIQGTWLEVPFPQEIEGLRVILLALSFLPLLGFGFWMLFPHATISKLLLLGSAFLAAYLGLAYVNAQVDPEHLLTRSDALARYVLAVPGGLLAGLGLHLRAGLVQKEGRAELAARFRWAAVGFGLYGLTQVMVPPSDMFPAIYLNSALFQNATGVPIQVIRASMAALVTVNLLRAIRITDLERERQLMDAQRSRLKALEQIQREMEQREAIRRELLRHTVIAQEEERKRIAREIHDETAQILTGFSLDLATLRSTLPRRSGKSETSGQMADEILNRLQKLARQMSQGLYRLVNDLRPAQLDDLGLAAALQHLAELEGAHKGVRVAMETTGPRQRLDPLVETVIFRVAQEALANISRHAEVDRAILRLACGAGEVRLEVCDQGVGFNPSQELVPPHGWGLAGMRERVESVGGKFQITSAPGKGTQVKVAIPFSNPGPSLLEEEIDAEKHTPDAGR